MAYSTKKWTLEEIKERRREAQRRYYLANKQKCIDASMRSRAKDPEKHRAVQSEYLQREADRIKVVNDRYREENRDRINAATRRWQAENVERLRAYQVEYRAKNIQITSERIGAWRLANQDRERRRLALWASNNKDKRCINEQNRRARKQENGGVLSPDIAKKLMRLQRGKCACCKASLSGGYHLDHVMPLALGGANDDLNIQLLCPHCNLSKNSKHPVEFMQKRGFLL